MVTVKDNDTVGGFTTISGRTVLVTPSGREVGSTTPKQFERGTRARRGGGGGSSRPKPKPKPKPQPKTVGGLSTPEGPKLVKPSGEEVGSTTPKQFEAGARAVPDLQGRGRDAPAAPRRFEDRIQEAEIFGEPVFLDRFQPNVGGLARGGFREFTGLFEPEGRRATSLIEASTGGPESRPTFLGSSTLAKGREILLTQKFDPGQIGVDLFFLPGFAIESSIPKLAQPRTIFRQAPVRPETVSRSIIEEGGIVKTGETSFIPARFETRASPLGELFGEFETRQITPRVSSSAFVEARVTPNEGLGTFTGFAGRKVRVGKRTRPTESFAVRGNVQELSPEDIISGTTSSEKRILSELGLDTKGFALSEDVKVFRSGAESAKILRGGREVSPGKRIKRTTDISIVRPATEIDDNVFQTLSGQIDITKGSSRGRVTTSRDVLADLRRGAGDVSDTLSDFTSARKLVRKPKADQVQAATQTSRNIVKNLRPKAPRPPKILSSEAITDVSNIPLVGAGAFPVLRSVPSEFAGTGQFERTDLIAGFRPGGASKGIQTPSSDITKINFPGGTINIAGRSRDDIIFRQRPRLDLGIKGIEVPRGGQRPRLKTKPEQITSQKQPTPFIQPPTTITTLDTPTKPPRTPPFSPRFRSSTERPGRFFLPFIPPLGFKDTLGGTRRAKRKLKRQPSLISAVLGITAPKVDKPQLEATGLVVRPIVRKGRKRRRR